MIIDFTKKHQPQWIALCWYLSGLVSVIARAQGAAVPFVPPSGVAECPHSAVEDSDPNTFAFPTGAQWTSGEETSGTPGGMTTGGGAGCRISYGTDGDRISRPGDQSIRSSFYAESTRRSLPFTFVPCGSSVQGVSGSSLVIGSGTSGHPVAVSQRNCRALNARIGQKRLKWAQLVEQALRFQTRSRPRPHSFKQGDSNGGGSSPSESLGGVDDAQQ